MTAKDYNPDNNYKEMDEPAYASDEDLQGNVTFYVALTQEIADLRDQLASARAAVVRYKHNIPPPRISTNKSIIRMFKPRFTQPSSNLD